MAAPLRDVTTETGVVPLPLLTDVSRRGAQPVPDGVGPEPMTPDDMQGALKLMLYDAIQYVDTELTPQRVKAIQYYKGELFGNEEEGRSTLVATTVRDVVLAAMPSFMRVFVGTERAVEFVPKRPELVEQTRQQSEYISMLVRRAPSSILSMQAAIKDGLRTRLGFVKWWWETMPESETTEMTGLTDEAVALLENEPDTTYTVRRSYPAAPALPTPPGTPPQPPLMLHDCSVTRIVTRGRAEWKAVPQEEILWSRASRDFTTAGLVAHRQEKRLGELVAMGFDWDEMVEQARSNYELLQNQENIERNDTTTTLQADSATADKTMWRVMLYECYARMDEDGDGIPELRQYYVVGTGHKLVPHPKAENGEYGVPVDEIPIAYWCPDPEGHTVEGQGLADLTMDLQRLDSELLRGMVNSMALALNPRTAVQEGRVNMRDLLSPDLGTVIRTRDVPGQVLQEYRHTFIGADVLPFVEYSKGMREERTGKSMEALGLSADTLQSSTPQGVAATLNAAQERTELMMRFFAEGIMVPLFRGLYRLTKRHQDYARTVRMQGKFVTVDPRTWDDDCEVEVKLALGGGMPAQKLAVLQAVIAKQEQILQMLGVANPMVSIAQYSQALFDSIEISGFPDPSRYFTLIDTATAQQIAQSAMTQPPKADPASTVAQAQASALASEMQLKQAQFQLELQKFQADQEYKAQTLRQQYVLAMEELEMKYAAKASNADIDRQMATEKAILEDRRLRDKNATDAALKVHQTETDAAVEREKAHTGAVTDLATAHLDLAKPPRPETE